MGTPLRGERKTRRLRSPLHEMDGVVSHLNFEEEEPVPSTPQDAEPVTMAGIAALLSSALAPFSLAMKEVKEEVANLRSEVEDNEDSNQVRHDNMQRDVESLRAQVGTYTGKCETLKLKVGKLEEVFEDLTRKGSLPRTLCSTSVEVAERERTAVLGGLSSLAGQEEAFQWLDD